jgi:hypothetical protein
MDSKSANDNCQRARQSGLHDDALSMKTLLASLKGQAIDIGELICMVARIKINLFGFTCPKNSISSFFVKTSEKISTEKVFQQIYSHSWTPKHMVDRNNGVLVFDRCLLGWAVRD